jgi:tetratricopeptide (TPR) repeat protein
MIQKIIIFISLIFQIITAESWIDTNIELTINGKFDQALQELEKRIQADSSDFKSYFYLAATLNSKMTHFENLNQEKEFYEAINGTIQLVENKNKKYLIIPDSIKAQYLFYLGSSYGYRAFFEGKKGNWYSALSDGLNAIDYLEEAVEIDSTLYQAYLGIGTYDYWSSSKLKFALWLPFIPDNRERGIDLIKKSMYEQGPSKYMAMHQLVYILIDFGAFDEAGMYAEQLIEKYPQSQFMWWAYAHVYYKQRNYEKAISSYLFLLKLIEQDEKANPAHFVKCNLKLVQLYFESNQYKKCIFHCNEIFDYENLNLVEDQLKIEIQETREYFETATERINKE